MDEVYLRAFHEERAHLHDSWANLLRLEPVSSALAHPDTLVHLINLTIDELFAAIGPEYELTLPRPQPETDCPCGMNPLLTYFTVGRQAVQEAFVIAETHIPPFQRKDRDHAFDQLESAYKSLAAREIQAFCGLCQYRKDPGHRRLRHVS